MPNPYNPDPREEMVKNGSCVKNEFSSYTNFIEPAEGGNSDFNFLYDLAGYEYQNGYKIKGAGLNVTNLNNDNKVYYRTKYSNSVSGHTPTYSGSQLKSLIKGNNNIGSTVLSNCVGYVCSRVNELWQIAVESKYIEIGLSKENFGQKAYYITHEGREITGSISIPGFTGSEYIIESGPNQSKVVPNKRACLMWRNWPGIIGSLEDFTGWARSSQQNNSLKDPIDVGPVPGAIICWGDYNGNDLDTNSCGHVGFVEKVINPGQPDEAIIYSESGYDDYHIQNNKIVQIKTIRKTEISSLYPYALSKKRRCVGFLISPVCQLISSVYFNSSSIFGSRPINISKKELKLRGISTSPTVWTEQKNPTKGDQVIIKSIGYREPNNKKEPVNLIKTPGVITAIIPMAEYPYGVSINNSFVPVAFYKRNGLILK